jgi:hypothetical protein
MTDKVREELSHLAEMRFANQVAFDSNIQEVVGLGAPDGNAIRMMNSETVLDDSFTGDRNDDIGSGRLNSGRPPTMVENWHQIRS